MPSVEPHDFASLVAAEREFDAAVQASPDVDGFCSGHAFSVAAFSGLLPGRAPKIYRVGPSPGEAGTGWLAFAQRHASLFGDVRPRELWEPFEAMWGLGCPIVGADVEVLAAALATVLCDDAPTATLLCCGLRHGSSRVTALAHALAGSHRLMLGSPTVRQVASLEGGVDGFLSRRSPRFRANIRRALRDADRHGVTHVRFVPDAAQARELYARAVTVDDRSWKGRSDSGLRASGLHDFYADMLPRLGARGALRMHFLVDADGVDVAYLFGGVHSDHGHDATPNAVGPTFRGLQFAFAKGNEARSLGNVAQYRAVESLCSEGALRYDLGTVVEYKRHWGELLDETLSIIATPRRSRL